MNPDREPLSPPTSPPPEEEEEEEGYAEASDSNCEDSYAPANDPGEKDDDSESAVEENDDYDSDSGNVPSSPPTSIENMSKNGQNRTVSGELLGDHSADGYRAPAVETEDEDDQDENHHTQREYFQTHYESGNDTFAQRKTWEGSQWGDEDGEPIRSRLSSPPLMARVQSQTSSRKSPAPGSPLFPARPRQNTSSAKSNLSHQFSRRSPTSRASSGSYDHRDRERDHREDQKKPPLVLLHVTLLLLPGAEEIVLQHLTPTTVERGVLVEHPRGDYNLLEELILDGLGLDEDYVEEATETEEPQAKTWEQALNITPVSPPKKAWQVRVYASNGLMTPGAWKRVWAEMERIDVEIWPRGYDRKRSSIRSFGFGSHSRGTSTSNISAILPSDEFATDDVFDFENDSRRKSYSGITRRSNSNSNSEFVASSAPVPTSPGRARTPSTAQKSRRVRTRTSTYATKFDFDFNRLLTPRSVVICAGINLLLFLYFTIFRSINVSAWKDSISSISFPFGGNDGMNGIQVHDVVDERCPVEVNNEGCAHVESSVTEGNIVKGEQKLLVDGEKTEDERDPEFVPDPEIGNVDDEIPVVQEDAEKKDEQGELDDDITSEHITTSELDTQLWLELEEPVEQDQKVEEETELEPKSVEETLGEAQEAEATADVEIDAQANQEADVEADVEADAEAATGEEEVEEKSKFSFLKGYFGGSN